MLCLSGLSPSEEAVDMILSGTKSAIDGSVDLLSLAPVPGLPIAASVLSSLIDRIMETRGNNDTRKGLANNIESLVALIKDTAGKVNEAVDDAGPDNSEDIKTRYKKSPELQKRVSTLVTELEKLNEEAAKLSRGSFFLRCLRSGRDAETLVALKDGISEARSNFLVQGSITIENLVNEHGGKLDYVVEKVTRIELHQRTDENETTLKALAYVESASYRSDLNTMKSRFLQGTRTGILEELGSWAKGIDANMLNHKMYVLSGAAGTGKSTIAYEIAKRFEKEKVLGASFFFVRGSEGLSTTRFVLPTIAYQLARNQPDLYPHIIEAARDHLKHGKHQQLEFVLEDLIIKPLMKVPETHPPVVIIIDAVDECTESSRDEVARLLYLLMQRLSDVPFPFRALITTRPEIHIEDAFRSVEFRDVAKPFKLHDIPQEIVDGDISRFLEDGFIKLRYSKELLETHPNAITDLTKRAEGLFIYASTAIDFLIRDAENAVENLGLLLSDVPSQGMPNLGQLDKLYLVVLNNAFPEQVLERPNIKGWIQTILGSIALLQDQVSPKTLESLVGVAVNNTRYTLARLGAVILMSDDPDSEIRPLHASFPQFLIDQNRCRNPTFHIDPIHHHGRLASACLNILNKPRILRENILRLGDRTVFKKDIPDLQELVKKHIPLHVQYACAHWATHLSDADPTSDILGVLDEFLSCKLLVWLEALSFMGRLEIAAPALLHIRAWYQTHAGESFKEDTFKLINDGYRFVLEYFTPINSCADQIYISALPFTPSCRLLDIYSARNTSDPSVQVVTDRDTRWGSCLRVIEGHTERVTSAKFSPNGRWVVSGAWDKTVRTWDAGSGAALNIMKGHRDGIEAVDFSCDNRRIVSGSSDTTLRIWDTASGAPLHKLNAKHGNVFSVAYSPDGKRIMSGSYNNALHMWDGRNGKKLEVMDGPYGCTNSVQFSPDGTLAVSASSDETIRVWDAENGDLLKTLRGHTDQVKCAAFFPDGKNIVSGASDNAVRIWNVDSEECLRVLKGHTGRVFCVAVSPKGDIIASGSGDSDPTIRLWDAKSGELLGALLDHTSWVFSLSFSPDGGRLVSASDDKSVRIWDLTDRGARNTVGHASAIDCVVFSRDGTRIATGSNDQTVAIWDTKSGKRVQVLKGHTDRVRSVAFSPDIDKIVSAGWDSEVRVWHVVSGNLKMSLRGHSKGVEAVAYSPDGRWIASGANNLEPTIRLWKASDGELERIIEVDFRGEPIDMIKSLEFSPDSTMVHTETINGLKYIWKCPTGELLDSSEDVWQLEAEKGRFKEEDGWIILKESGKKLCWLTGSKRGISPDGASVSHSNYYAVGAGSGQFTILDLSELVD